ncbi:MAG: nitroreductase family protein [Euzebyaceae bacterium]|nr:nitroreductase family protein [Euzebyaceae bacterium]
MDFAEAVRRRRMVRAYRPDPVEPAALERILDAATRGPSAGFSQGQTCVVVTDADDRRRIAELCDEPAYVARGFDPWISQAPVHVVVCTSRTAYERRYAEPDKAGSDPPAAWDVPFWWVDAGAALMLLLLAATNEGLAAGFQSIDGAAVGAFLGIPPEHAPLGLVTIGHPAPDRPSGSLRRGRRPAVETVHHGRW